MQGKDGRTEEGISRPEEMEMQALRESKNGENKKRPAAKIRGCLRAFFFISLFLSPFPSYPQKNSSPADLYREGMASLRQGKLAKAREFLNAALNQEEANFTLSPLELNLLTREGISKEKLSQKKLGKMEVI